MVDEDGAVPAPARPVIRDGDAHDFLRSRVDEALLRKLMVIDVVLVLLHHLHGLGPRPAEIVADTKRRCLPCDVDSEDSRLRTAAVFRRREVDGVFPAHHVVLDSLRNRGSRSQKTKERRPFCRLCLAPTIVARPEESEEARPNRNRSKRPRWDARHGHRSRRFQTSLEAAIVDEGLRRVLHRRGRSTRRGTHWARRRHWARHGARARSRGRHRAWDDDRDPCGGRSEYCCPCGSRGRGRGRGCGRRGGCGVAHGSGPLENNRIPHAAACPCLRRPDEAWCAIGCATGLEEDIVASVHHIGLWPSRANHPRASRGATNQVTGTRTSHGGRCARESRKTLHCAAAGRGYLLTVVRVVNRARHVIWAKRQHARRRCPLKRVRVLGCIPKACPCHRRPGEAIGTARRATLTEPGGEAVVRRSKLRADATSRSDTVGQASRQSWKGAARAS
mmetsp:Transcript_5977/g.12136  ORF Transcript_5977/g.12136 Transcript_5977/m.12136 type:complete len:447 (+) Transcript_5977:556-1896(+)